jgi:hypothetical protein
MCLECLKEYWEKGQAESDRKLNRKEQRKKEINKERK